ncbi:MAG: hypothetical protein DRG59_09575 [Deltaproteobacteria bacterium]|nr:MAG: hypothetical protein DRG59_09575 [Deltaproteobacteria bacterium]
MVKKTIPPWDEEHWLPGVLSRKQMEKLVDREYIQGVKDFEQAADLSSLDLHLSDKGYRMKRGSIKPQGDRYSDILDNSELTERLSPEDDGSFYLMGRECYVFELEESLTPHLFEDAPIYGQATAKSSVGRTDVIARLIVDGMYRYESMNPAELKNGMGRMYLEIIPISFNVKVKPGISLSQLRLFYGEIRNAEIRDTTFIKGILHGSSDGQGYLSVDISNTKVGNLEVAAFCAKGSLGSDDYIPLWSDRSISLPNPCKYWRFKKASEDGRLEIESEDFYIIRSKERISLPPGVAVYARAMDESLGEMRIHYAGFAHPFFGMQNDGGTPLIFEVRGHHVNVNLGDGEKLAKLVFYRMSENAEKPDEPPAYTMQDLTLSKYFAQWPERLEYVDSTKGEVKESGGNLK